MCTTAPWCLHVLMGYFTGCHVITYNTLTRYTVDRERFTGLNIHSFSAIKVLTEILLHCLGHKCSLFSTIKERCLYSQKNFCGTTENRRKRESLVQQIFPHLQYHTHSSCIAIWQFLRKAKFVDFIILAVTAYNDVLHLNFHISWSEMGVIVIFQK